MEKVIGIRGMRRLACGLTLAAACLAAASAHSQSPAEKVLLDKAHVLEQSGHTDLAPQSWQQVLLSDPTSQDGLAGLARWAKVSGHEAEAQRYVQRLRAINPKNPEIDRIQSLMSNRQQDTLLQQASQRARAGHNEQALRLYRQAFGNHPQDNWALAYYDAEAAIPGERQDAVEGLRGLMARFPGDPRYAVDLGRVLTYDVRTRSEGERLLRQHPQEEQAQLALRQALLWDVQNPIVNHRSGTAGYDSLTALEAPFEISSMLGAAARLTLIARPVLLDAGVATVSPILPGNMAEHLGTAQPSAVLGQQNASGGPTGLYPWEGLRPWQAP